MTSIRRNGVAISDAPPRQTVDAFGDDARERLLRRLMAAAFASWIYAAIFGLWVFPPSVILAVVAAYLLALPVSYLMERPLFRRRVGLTVLRYGLLGAALGCISLAIILQALPWVWAMLASVIGAICGGVGAWAATVFPARWVSPASVFSTILISGTIAAVVVAGLPSLTD